MGYLGVNPHKQETMGVWNGVKPTILDIWVCLKIAQEIAI
jgi:hypothetical protein